ncbi:MAG: hypothetical protein DSY92_08145 [Planctomycetota bacterium]|nr:MAG: hypothetical protein DSY92_08145 [Planctomycetota bacterium]
MRIEPSNKLISTHRNDQIGHPTVNRPVQTAFPHPSHEVEHRSQLGSAMLVTLFMIIVIGMISAATVASTLTRSEDSRFQLDRLKARTIAEAILDAAQKDILVRTANFDDPFAASTIATGTVVIGGTEYDWNAVDLTPDVYSDVIDSTGWRPIDVLYDSTDTGGPTQTLYTRVVQLFPGTTPASGIEVGIAMSHLRRTIEVQRNPLFDFAIFYDDDLELLPGPSMTFAGKVHANGDIYVGVGGTLTIDSDYFRCTGEIFRERKNNGSTTNGTVKIQDSDGNFQTLANNQDFDAWSDPQDWIDFADGQWGGTVQTGSHGILTQNAPDIGSIANNGHYRNSADLVIRNDHIYHVQNGVEVDITLQMPNAISESTTDMYDAREETYVPLTELDLSNPAFQNYVTSINSDADPTNDIHQVYAYRSPDPEPANWDPGAANNWLEGIRLINGSELPADLLFVSEDPIYVQGDFNTTNKKTAAVISDAVNLLSNNWSDDREPGDSYSDIDNAAETTYNMAMITGNVRTPDGGGNYSGGLENLPRFHEKWSNKKANINGAFINLFQSRVATERWGKSGVYKPPIRNWLFDSDLLNSSTLRNLFPQAVGIDRLVWDEGEPLMPGVQ